MFMDSAGLEGLLGLDGYGILKKIGYPDEDIVKFAKQGDRFRIAVFPSQSEILLATWDNLLLLVRRAWPHSNIPAKLEYQLPVLKTLGGPEGYANIMSRAPTGFSERKILAEDLERLQGKLWEVRKFLHDQLNLNPLFLGNGWIYSDAPAGGKNPIGAREYFGLNGPLRRLRGVQTLDLTVTQPH